ARKATEHMASIHVPTGRGKDEAPPAAAHPGVLSIQWDLVTGDPDPLVSAKSIASRILAKAHPGAIIVAHATGRGHNTAEALAMALPKLKEEGYSFVTVSELLQAGKPVIATRCYQNSPNEMTHVARSTAERGSHDLFSIFTGPN